MEDLGRIKLFEYQIRLFQDGNQFFENTFKNNVLVIGRDDDCDLIIQDRSISRKHLRIEIDVDKFYVTDMGSSNGSFVDNVKIEGRTRISDQSHIRAGKITVQVIMPELNKKVDLKDLNKLYPKQSSSDFEGTLSRIALHVEDALERTSQGQDPMAMVDRDFIVDLTRQHGSTGEKFISKKIESLVLWNKIIYDINEFGFRDTISVGPEYDDSIHVPSIPFQWTLSTFEHNEAVFCVPKNLNVFAIREGNYLSKQQLVSEKRISEDKNSIRIQISHYDVLRVEIDANTQLYFRYVPSTVELGSKRLLNPDVLIKKALVTSFFIHLFLSLIFFAIPKEKLSPPEKKEPERIAKLIVEEKKPEPPPVVIPPPEPPKPPEPPPPPPPEVKKPEPPPPPPPKKVEPPKPKPKPKKEPPPPKKVEKLPPPKPVEKASQVVNKPVPAPVQAKPAENPKGDNKPSAPAPVATAPAPTPAPPAPPPPKPVDITKLGALAAMSGMKLDAKSTKAAPAINIAQNTSNTNTGAPEVGLNAIAGDLKNQTAGAAQGNASSAGGPIKTKGSKSVGAGYGNEALGTGTGKRGVKGAVVGTPKLAQADNQRTEGLSRDQVLKAIQPYLGKIQSCYERAMLNDPNLAGVIDFEWTISAPGAVKSVNIKKNSVAGGEQLGDCVSGVIRGIKFPTATNGEETNPNISFPFGRL